MLLCGRTVLLFVRHDWIFVAAQPALETGVRSDIHHVATIKVSNGSVLFRIAQSVVMPPESGGLEVVKESMTGEFGAVIADYRERQSATFSNDDQLAT